MRKRSSTRTVDGFLGSLEVAADEQDCNLGLVHQVVGAVLERKILKTKAVYSRLTIDQLVAKLATSRPRTSEEVIAKLQDMVSRPFPAWIS